MESDENEEKLLRSVVLQNANSILLARQRAEQELIRAKEALERKTEELAHSLGMMRATLESTTDAILVTDEYGRVTGFNQKFVEMWRLPREVMETRKHRQLLEVTGRQFKEPEKFRSRIEEIYASSPPESFDLLELAEGGVLERFSRIQFVEERNVGRVWSFRDITERRRAEEELRQQREWFQVTLSSIGDAVITTDTQVKVTFLNPVAEMMTGWKSGEASGQHLEKVFNIINEETRQPTTNPVHKVLREGIIVGLANHTALIAKDGTETAIEDSAAPIKDATGKISGAVMVFHDVTERRRAEQALREAQDKLSRHAEDLEKQVAERTATLRETIGELEAFSYSITHDMRAPLRAMQSFATILADECASQVSPEGKEYIRRITTAAERMDRLIQDVLTYSRTARTELPLERVDVEKLLRDIQKSYPKFHAAAADIQLEGSCPPMDGTEAVLTKCISNLLGNAIKFVAPGVTPRVRVWAETVDDGKMVRLFFKDNGLGIDKEVHQTIFGIFQRVSKNYGGTGIGLAIVKKGVERMGGSVGLESEPGHGSKFWLELKRANDGTE